MSDHETELKPAKETTEKFNQIKSEFIENISHDIKTPIAGIISIAEILSLQLQDSHLKEYADDLRRSSTQLLRLFDDAMNMLGRNNEPATEHIIFNLKETAQGVIDFLKPSLLEKNLKFEFIFSENIQQFFIGSRSNLYRVILNLMSNGIKFSHENGHISLQIRTLKTENTIQFIEVIVSNTGIGIPIESQDVIFERYTRLNPAYSSEYKGSGLGLYIVKQMVDELRGEIRIESEIGGWTRFYITLPLAVAFPCQEETLNPIHKISAITTNEKHVDAQHIHVLLVEDNLIAQKISKSLLTLHNCSVDIAVSGEEAIQKFKTQQYNLVFMDIGLPNISGYETTKLIREYEKTENKAPVLIFGLTAHVQKPELEEGIKVGMNDVFAKPINVNLLNLILPKV